MKAIPIQRKKRSPLRLGITATSGKSMAAFLRPRLCAVHALLGKKAAIRELSVALVSDRAMSRLHEHFLGICGPTDVLSFPLEFDSAGRPTSGEIVINVAEAGRRARALKIPHRLEVLLYALHGLLHLSGYDDRTRSGFVAMHRMEDRLLARLGVGPVFNVAASKQRSRR